MITFIFNFGMRYRESRNPLLRFAAKLCIAEGKREADHVEKKLKRMHLGEMNAEDARSIQNKIRNQCAKKG